MVIFVDVIFCVIDYVEHFNFEKAVILTLPLLFGQSELVKYSVSRR